MLATCKIFDKICLKAIRDTILSTIWSNVGQGNSIFEWGWYPIEGKSFFFELAEIHTHTRTRANEHTHKHAHTHKHTRAHTRNSVVSRTYWSPPKENPDKGAWPAYYNDFDESEKKYFLSKQYIYRLSMKKKWQIFDSVQSTDDYPTISR